ncbi:MAG: DinB family protein [bacterium]
MPDQGHGFPENLTADMIRADYDMLLERILQQAATKTEADLQVVYRFFDKLDVSLSQMMRMLISHEVHHRSQLSVLMRQGKPCPSRGSTAPTQEATRRCCNRWSRARRSAGIQPTGTRVLSPPDQTQAWSAGIQPAGTPSVQLAGSNAEAWALAFSPAGTQCSTRRSMLQAWSAGIQPAGTRVFNSPERVAQSCLSMT